MDNFPGFRHTARLVDGLNKVREEMESSVHWATLFARLM